MSEPPSSVALSFVVPVYNEEGNVAPLHAELTRAATSLGRSYEILFVDDGSRDATRARLAEIQTRDPHLRVVELDGNFGEAAALSAGFSETRGEVVVTLDGDGQNDPADVPALLARLGPDIDVVSGRRRERQEAFVTRVLPSRIANWLIARATGVSVYDCGCGLKAYRREVLRNVQLPRGMNRFLPAILGVAPSRVAEVSVNDRRRGSGQSHYGLSRTLVVLRDLLALPLLVRRPTRGPMLGRALGGVQAALVLALLVLVLGVLGWPKGRGPVAGTAVIAGVVAGIGWAVAYNVERFVRAQAEGVFRIRRSG